MSTCRRSERIRAQAQDGFTLFEMLVGMALLALVVALLPGALRLGARAWEAGGDLERTSDLTLALDMLEQRIAEAVPVFERDASGSIGVSFVGDRRTLGFVSASENGPGGAGVYRYRLEPRLSGAVGSQNGGLVVTMSLYVPSPVPARDHTGWTETKQLIPEPTAVEFRYFGSQPAGAPSQWHPAWERRDVLPALVEVHVDGSTRPPGVARRLLIAPRIDVRS